MDTFEENDGMKYLVFTPTEKSKEGLKEYTELWKETKRQIEAINDDEPIEYRKDFMKIKFESNNDLPLGKTFKIFDMMIVVASVLKNMLNIMHKFVYMNMRISYKNAAIQKN